MLQSGKKLVKFISAFLLCFASICASFQMADAQPVQQEKADLSMSTKVNINEADAATIAKMLDGIGESRAKAIVEYREKHGPFTSLEELAEVKGVGQATLSLNRGRITLE